jgi:hypothetical protein
MAYIITSDRLDFPKAEGSIITDEELLAVGVNIEALIEGGHITEDGTNTKKKAPEAPSAVDPVLAVQSEATTEGETP